VSFVFLNKPHRAVAVGDVGSARVGTAEARAAVILVSVVNELPAGLNRAGVAITADFRVIRCFASPVFVFVVGNQRSSTSSFRLSLSTICDSQLNCTGRATAMTSVQNATTQNAPCGLEFEYFRPTTRRCGPLLYQLDWLTL